MKQILLYVALFISTHVLGQKDFEGTIKYSVTKIGGGNENEIDYLYNYFAPGKLKAIAEHYDSSQNGQEDCIMDLNERAFYKINNLLKEVTRDTLNGYSELIPVGAKNRYPGLDRIIMGYNTFAYMSSYKRYPESKKTLIHVYWYFDSLYYHTNDTLAASDNIPLLTSGKNVCAGFLFGIMEDTSKRVIVEAIEIIPKFFSASDFELPKDYALNNKMTYEAMRNVMESVKPKKQPVKKITPAKSKAIPPKTTKKTSYKKPVPGKK